MQGNSKFAKTCALNLVEKIRALDIQEYGSNTHTTGMELFCFHPERGLGLIFSSKKGKEGKQQAKQQRINNYDY
jgi:hypothetical protein